MGFLKNIIELAAAAIVYKKIKKDFGTKPEPYDYSKRRVLGVKSRWEPRDTKP